MNCPKCGIEKEYNWQASCNSCHVLGLVIITPEAELETSAKPKRYNSKGTLEVWDAIEQLGLDYKQGNILKYIYRSEDKNGPEDLVKAINYIIKMISVQTGEDYYDLHKLSPEDLSKKIKKK